MNRKIFPLSLLVLLCLVPLGQADTQRWIGAAAPVEQRDVIAFGGTWAAGEDFVITCNSKSITVTMGSSIDTTTEVAAAVAEAIMATSHDAANLTADMTINMGGYEPGYGEFRDMRTEVSGSTLYVISAVPGTPFDISIDASDSASGTATLTSDGTGGSVLATGPNDFTNAANWSTNAAPAAGDVLIFDHKTSDVLYNLGNSYLNIRIYVYSAFTNNIGLPKVHDSPAGALYDYSEYRSPRYLGVPIEASIGVVQLYLGDDVPLAPTNGLRYFDIGTNTGTTCEINVFDAGGMTSDGHSVQILGGRTIDAKVYGGTVSFGDLASGNACQFDSLEVIRRGTATPPTVLVGPQCVLNSSSTVDNAGGTLSVDVSGANSTFQLHGGITHLLATTAANAAHVRSGATLKNRTGTITSLYVYGGGTYDASESSGHTVTNATFHPGATINDVKSKITLSNPASIPGGALSDVNWITGDGVTVDVTGN